MLTNLPPSRARVARAVAASFLLAATPAMAQRPAPTFDDEPTPPALKTARPAPASAAAPDETLSATSEVPAAPEGTGTNPDSYLPSLMGPIGLYGMSTAEVGPVNHLRLALHGQYFQSSGFLVTGDENSRMNGNFSFGFTPHKYVEIFGAILTSSNRNTRTNSFEPPRRDPELIKSFGDLVLGPKVILPVARGMTAGFELGLRFLSSISDLSVSPSSTSLWIGPLYSFDLRKVSSAPLRLHAAASFYIDNSDNLINFNDPTISKYTKMVATFAYGIAKTRFRFAAGFDVPLEERTTPVPLTFFGEYHAEIVTAAADPTFMNEPNDTGNRDMHWLTAGVRARVYRGITLDAGADVRLRSVGYEYGAPLPPYNIVFGAAYPFDIDAFTKPVVVTRTIEKTVGAPPPLEGQVKGIVKSARDGKPIAGALISAGGRPLSRVGTDPDGAFQSVPLPPGPINLDVSAPGYDAAKVNAVVVLAHPTKVDVTLTPKLVTGNVRGTVKDAKGTPLPAALRLAGAEVFSAQADSNGVFSAALPVGAYRVTAEMPQMPPKEATVDVVEGQDRTLDIVMRSGSYSGGAAISGDAITTKTPIKFKSGSKLDPKTAATVGGVAELLQDRPEVRVRIDTYWDSSAGKGAQKLTEDQAKAIKAELVKKGVAEGRIETAGHGAENPLVPNIGPVNKAKNRRVELHVLGVGP